MKTGKRIIIRQNMEAWPKEEYRVIFRHSPTVIKTVYLSPEQLESLRNKEWRHNYEWDIW